MPEENQIYIFNSGELSLIKNTFAENDVLIYAIRKVFLQFPLTDQEKTLIKNLSLEVIAVLRKRILPDIGPEFPLGQIPSILTTVSQKINQLTPEEMKPHMDALSLEINYLEQQFKVLEGGEDETLRLSEIGELNGKTPEKQFSDLTAYLFLLGYIDPMLQMIKTIAGEKGETLEQLNERMKRDSTK